MPLPPEPTCSRVPFSLRKAPVHHPVAGWLLPSLDLADLTACLEGLRPTWPVVHATALGWLLRFDDPPARTWPGAIRLRRLADDLLVPADADLCPALLPDEADALVRERGLVWLPGDRL